MSKIINTEILQGKYVNLRDIELEDAEFILNLRCDAEKSKHINKTSNDIKKQEDYIRQYKTLDNEWYFIIENKNSKSIGSYRLYDLKEDSFGIGSWIMINGVGMYEAIEGEFLARKFGFDVLGFNKLHFDVRKQNKKVVTFHKNMGAKIVAENEIDYFFECTKEDYLRKVKKFLG